MRPTNYSHRRLGFTLVELLVVVAIISVLVAILLPALGRARQHAQRLRCSANLHSIGHALILYTQQYRFYPGTGVQDISRSPSTAAIWPVRLRPFLSGNREVFYCPSQDERCQWNDLGPQPVVASGGELFAAFGYEEREPLVHIQAYFSYAYNAYGFSSSALGKGLGAFIRAGDTGPPHEREVALARVKAAEDMIVIADSNADGVADFVMRPDKAPTLKVLWPGKIHRGGANVLFCDGHVSWYPQADLLVEYENHEPANELRARRWNVDHLPQ